MPNNSSSNIRIARNQYVRSLSPSILLSLLVAVLLSVSCASAKVAESYSVPYDDYLTPQLFGARGDGKTDDTDALRKALYESDRQGKVLYFPSGAKYKVTGTLNYINGTYQNLKLNMLGCIPVMKGSYIPQEYGGISVGRGVKLFKDATMTGSIQRMCITGQRDLNVHFFNNCDCKGIVIKESNISNFGALFYDTPLHTVSQITQNTFLTLFYFARNENRSCGMTDATITHNYINGGMEQNDNACFEWSYYNGCIIAENFIDYYRTIYAPKAQSKQAFVGPLSFANQYQVFRYFYTSGANIQTVTFSSTADSFNWNDPSTLEKLQKYVPLTYKGKDDKTYDIPPYVACCNSAWNITIKDAKVERNMKSLVFIASTLTQYEYNRFDVSFTGNNKYKDGQINYKQGDDKPFYNSGNYFQNTMRIEGVVEVLDELPQLSTSWSASTQGRTVKVGEKIYRAVNKVEGKKRIARWEEINQGEN